MQSTGFTSGTLAKLYRDLLRESGPGPLDLPARISSEMCKGLTICWSSKVHLVVSSKFYESAKCIKCWQYCYLLRINVMHWVTITVCEFCKILGKTKNSHRKWNWYPVGLISTWSKLPTTWANHLDKVVHFSLESLGNQLSSVSKSRFNAVVNTRGFKTSSTLRTKPVPHYVQNQFHTMHLWWRGVSLNFLLICRKFNIFTNFDDMEQDHAQSVGQVASSWYHVCHYYKEKFAISGTHRR